MSKSKNNNVQQFYDKVGDYFSHTRKWLWPEMLPYLNRVEENDTVLDIGCGNGRLLNGIKKPVKYVGVDFSKILLGNARKLHPKEKFVYGDILNEKSWKDLPQADAIFSVAVLHHISSDDLPKLLNLMVNKLKPGGFLYISSWNLWQKKYFKYHFSKKSLISKIRNLNFRYVWVPFAKKHLRFCVSYLKEDVKIKTLTRETVFLSENDSYSRGKNIVWVFVKK